jgi:hypothetical protein
VEGARQKFVLVVTVLLVVVVKVVMATDCDGGSDNSGGEFGHCIGGGYYGAGGDSSGRAGIINSVKVFYLLRLASKKFRILCCINWVNSLLFIDFVRKNKFSVTIFLKCAKLFFDVYQIVRFP